MSSCAELGPGGEVPRYPLLPAGWVEATPLEEPLDLGIGEVPVVDVARSDVAAAHEEAGQILASSLAAVAVAASTEAKAPSESEARTLKSKANIRQATVGDVEQLVDLDHRMFGKAYGAEMPDVDTVRNMLTRRIENLKGGNGWMFVCEVNGRVQGFVSAFKTSKPWDKFVSWEDSTNGGTLDGKADPQGKYVYVANMTIAPEASKHHARERLLANLFAEGFKDGVEYGYFESRMPGFKRWLTKEGVDPAALSPEQLTGYAEYYANDKVMRNGKEVTRDFQLRMYEGIAERGQGVLPNAFHDDESLNYGVIFKASLPRLPKPARYAAAWALKAAARSPKLASKLF